MTLVGDCPKKNWKRFEEWAMPQLVEGGIKVDIRKGRYMVDEQGRYRGCFDGERLSVAGGNAVAQWTFVHEFSHFLQWMEDREFFEKPDSLSVIGERELTIADWPLFQQTLRLERDCEDRSIKLGRRFGLFDAGQYARRSNVYFYFYQYVFLTGKWTNTASLNNKRLIGLMPKRLVPLDKLDKIDMVMMGIYDEVLCGKRRGKK